MAKNRIYRVKTIFFRETRSLSEVKKRIILITLFITLSCILCKPFTFIDCVEIIILYSSSASKAGNVWLISMIYWGNWNIIKTQSARL